MRTSLSLLMSLTFVVGCSATDPPADPPLGVARAAVINGSIDKPEKYPSTVMIMAMVDATASAGCSGTLISTRVVVTARHCVSKYYQSTRSFGADYDKSKMGVWYGAEPRGSADNTVVKVVYPPSTTIENNDFALLVLGRPATPAFAPIRLAKPPKAGAFSAVAGYGLSNDGVVSGPAFFHPRYQRQNLQILAVGPTGGYLGSRELMLGESICSGDSGGPVYDQTTGALLAVTSRGGNGTAPSKTTPYAGCVGSKTYNTFTRVDGFAALIKSTLAEVSEVPWEEGTAKPPPPTPTGPTPGDIGAICGGPADCVSKICISYEGKQVCSKACTDKSACPENFDCVSGYCVPNPPPPPIDTLPPVDDAGIDPPAADPVPEPTQKGGCSVVAGHGPSSWNTAPLAAMVALLLRRRRR